MSQVAEIKGLKELIASMKAFPTELAKVFAVTMTASLTAFHEKVPPYPPQDPGADYIRTGTLGKSLGSGMQGGAMGAPSIFRVRKFGAGDMEGEFGTNLEYANLVIGEKQAGMHSSNWWNIILIAQRAADKIERLWQMAADKLAAFLERKGV